MNGIVASAMRLTCPFDKKQLNNLLFDSKTKTYDFIVYYKKHHTSAINAKT